MSRSATTSYVSGGLPSATDYTVCFFASPQVTGGSTAEATGYANECYDNQVISGSPTPVTVTAGVSRIVDAVLVEAGQVSGTVIDAGSHSGVALVLVSVTSLSTGFQGSALTAIDGSYSLPGVPAGTDYTVCFSASGYVGQRWRNQPTSGTFTPVSVTLGAVTPAIDAALVGAG